MGRSVRGNINYLLNEIRKIRYKIFVIQKSIEQNVDPPLMVGGIYTFEGDGSTTSFQIPTGWMVIPTSHYVTRKQESTGALISSSADNPGFIIVTFIASPPPAGTYQYNWGAFLIP